MNFTILFHIIGTLNFHVQFSLHSDYTQDFFIFQGVNSYAYLYRNNGTVSLYMRDDKSFQLFQANISNELEFSWRGFKINGTEMKLIKSTGSTDMDDLNEFTFLSPVLDLQPDILMETCALNSNEISSESKSISSLNLKNVNYGYIAAIILMFAIALELKIKIPLLINRLIQKDNDPGFEESDYVSMEVIETEL